MIAKSSARAITLVVLVCCLTLLALPLCSAEELTSVQVNKCSVLKISCDNCTYVNLTKVWFPNQTTAFNGNTNMTPDNSSTVFEYTFCGNNVTGTYTYSGFGNPDGIKAQGGGEYEVTYTGKVITAQQSYIYVIALIFLVLLMFGSVFIINKLPGNDSVDAEGAIVHVSQMKHFRKVLWCFVWIIGIAIVFIISNISIAYLDNLMVGNLFFAIYRIMFYFTIVGVPIYFVWIFYKVMQDKEVQRLINRGVEIKGTP